MDFLTQQNITAYGIGGAIVVGIVSILVKDGLVSLLAYWRERGQIQNARDKHEIASDVVDETLEHDTRKLQYDLARTALDKSEQLSRLKDEYREQGDLVARQAMEIERLKPFEQEVKEARITIENLRHKLEYCISKDDSMSYLLEDDKDTKPHE